MATNNVTNRMRPIHPGEILREELLAPLNLSASAVALALRVPAPRINAIVRERRAISPDTARRLARHFDTSAQLWINLQRSYDLKQAQDEAVARIDREVIPLRQRAWFAGSGRTAGSTLGPTYFDAAQVFDTRVGPRKGWPTLSRRDLAPRSGPAGTQLAPCFPIPSITRFTSSSASRLSDGA